jgi:hypothetical protein
MRCSREASRVVAGAGAGASDFRAGARPGRPFGNVYAAAVPARPTAAMRIVSRMAGANVTQRGVIRRSPGEEDMALGRTLAFAAPLALAGGA